MDMDSQDSATGEYEDSGLLPLIDKKKLPRHIAIIMDGNGRWARQRGLERIKGHQEGAVSARIVAESCARIGIKFLTFYTFSTENWKRPLKEVNMLLNMLYDNLLNQKELLIKNKIRLNILGKMDRLPAKLQKELSKTIELSKNHKNMQINMALNYGARDEIIEAIKQMLRANLDPSRVKEKTLQKYLYTRNCPDPDLLIRTSGELRLSNFLLYQLAYTELYFTDVLWPDFRQKELLSSIIEFQNRKRRYGAI